MGFGSVSLHSLDEFRVLARRARQAVYAEDDPIELRKAKRDARKSAARKMVPFAKCAAAYIKFIAPTWRGGISGRSAAQWEQSLQDYVFPSIGKLPVGAVEKGHVKAILEPLWETKTVTAERIRGRIEAILDFAKGLGQRSGDNPAAWKGNLDAVLAKAGKMKTVAHAPVRRLTTGRAWRVGALAYLEVSFTAPLLSGQARPRQPPVRFSAGPFDVAT
jgi:hypothetical protein